MVPDTPRVAVPSALRDLVVTKRSLITIDPEATSLTSRKSPIGKTALPPAGIPSQDGPRKKGGKGKRVVFPGTTKVHSPFKYSRKPRPSGIHRSEEHTSELQSR